MQQWDGVEKRNDAKERRGLADRRLSQERRFDYRAADPPGRRSVKSWVRSLSNARLGVDRRKGVDRRVCTERRYRELRSLLTPEELADLLQE